MAREEAYRKRLGEQAQMNGKRSGTRCCAFQSCRRAEEGLGAGRRSGGEGTVPGRDRAPGTVPREKGQGPLPARWPCAPAGLSVRGRLPAWQGSLHLGRAHPTALDPCILAVKIWRQKLVPPEGGDRWEAVPNPHLLPPPPPPPHQPHTASWPGHSLGWQRLGCLWLAVMCPGASR